MVSPTRIEDHIDDQIVTPARYEGPLDNKTRKESSSTDRLEDKLGNDNSTRLEDNIVRQSLARPTQHEGDINKNNKGAPGGHLKWQYIAPTHLGNDIDERSSTGLL